MIGYHFVGEKLRDGSPIPPDGEWLEFEGEPILCQQGFHASEHPRDAFKYAPGKTLCLVELDGKIVKGDDKFVSTRRKIIKRIDANNLLSDFSMICVLRAVENAESVLPIFEKKFPNDLRPRKAIEMARKISGGDKTDNAAADAAHAAHAAAYAAAHATAHAAAYAAHAAAHAAYAADAAAHAAAHAAAYAAHAAAYAAYAADAAASSAAYAAHAAAYAAAYAAAHAAASPAAHAAADATADAERKWQREEFKRLVDEAFK